MTVPDHLATFFPFEALVLPVGFAAGAPFVAAAFLAVVNFLVTGVSNLAFFGVGARARVAGRLDELSFQAGVASEAFGLLPEAESRVLGMSVGAASGPAKQT